MTLEKALFRFRTRFAINANADVDIDNNDVATECIEKAAKEVARVGYFLYSWQSALTLEANAPEANLLDPAICADAIFHLDGVFLNGAWLEEIKPGDMLRNFPAYMTDAPVAKPSNFVRTAPSIIRFLPAPNATAVAASNLVKGWREHRDLEYMADKDLALDGPSVMHDLIIDRAYLDNCKSYVVDGEDLTRRALIQREYEEKIGKYSDDNKAQYKPILRRDGAGQTRRYSRIG